jgi:Glycine zipper
MYTGYGLVLGAALGLLAGTLLSSEPWIAPLLGAAVGLVIGAMVRARRGRTAAADVTLNALRHAFVTPCIRYALYNIGMSMPRSFATRRAMS